MSEQKKKPDKPGQGGQGQEQGQGGRRPGYEVLIYHEQKEQNPDRITLQEPDTRRQQGNE